METINGIRKRIPYAYWLLYDIVIAPLLLYGLWAVSGWYAIGVLMLCVAVFFDVNEAISKWEQRRGNVG